MISAIRAYQPVQIPGKTSINMISVKQLPELVEIRRTDNGFVVIGNWKSLWGETEVFNIYIPDANIQFAYVTDDKDTRVAELQYQANKFTHTELKALAKARGIPTNQRTKQELIDELNTLGI